MVDVYSLVLLSNSFRKYFRAIPYINWGCAETLPSFLFNIVSCIIKFLFCSPHYFKYIKISALALLKMVSTAYENYVRSSKFLRTVCCKDRLSVYKIEKTDFPKLCQNKGLSELLLKI